MKRLVLLATSFLLAMSSTAFAEFRQVDLSIYGMD